MKILKILLIILVPAIGIVGCKKSELKPANPATTEVTTPDNSAAAKVKDSGNNVSYARIKSTTEDDITPIVGSGDDDRDGGDKRRKK